MMPARETQGMSFGRSATRAGVVVGRVVGGIVGILVACAVGRMVGMLVACAGGALVGADGLVAGGACVGAAGAVATCEGAWLVGLAPSQAVSASTSSRAAPICRYRCWLF